MIKIVGGASSNNSAPTETRGPKTSFFEEEKRDPSSDGEKSSMAAKVIEPKMEIKKFWFQKFIGENSNFSLSKTRSIINHMFPIHQKDMQKQFSSDFFAKLIHFSQTKSGSFCGSSPSSLLRSAQKRALKGSDPL